MSSLTKRIMKTTTTTTSSASSRIIGGDEESVDDAGGGGGGGGGLAFRRAAGPPNQRSRGFDSTASTGDDGDTEDLMEPDLSDTSHMKFVDGRCSCCPYGYHVDLDFLQYLESMNNGDYLNSLKKLHPNKEELKKSLKSYLEQQELARRSNATGAGVPPSVPLHGGSLAPYDRSVVVGGSREILSDAANHGSDITYDKKYTETIELRKAHHHRRHHELDSGSSLSISSGPSSPTAMYSSPPDVKSQLHPSYGGRNLTESSMTTTTTTMTSGTTLPKQKLLEDLEQQLMEIKPIPPTDQFQHTYVNSSGEFVPGSTRFPTNDQDRITPTNENINGFSRQNQPRPGEQDQRELRPGEHKMRPGLSDQGAITQGQSEVTTTYHTEIRHDENVQGGQGQYDVKLNQGDVRFNRDELGQDHGNSTEMTRISASTLQAIREQMAACLQRMHEMEEQIKTIPVLQVRNSVLKEEKRMLELQLQSRADRMRSIGVGDFTVDESDLDERSEYSYKRFLQTLSEDERRRLAGSRADTDGTDGDGVYRSTTTVSLGYGVDGELIPVRVHEKELKTEENTEIKEKEVKTVFLGGGDDVLTADLTGDRAGRAPKLLEKLSKKDVKSIGVGEGNVFDALGGVEVHQKELRTVYIGDAEKHQKSTRNVGILCKPAMRDVGMVHMIDSERPMVRTIAVGVGEIGVSMADGGFHSGDEGLEGGAADGAAGGGVAGGGAGLQTMNAAMSRLTISSSQSRFLGLKGDQLRSLLDEVLKRTVHTVAVQCNFNTEDKGVDAARVGYDMVDVACSDDVIDVDVVPIRQMKSVAIDNRPSLFHRACGTDAVHKLDMATNTQTMGIYHHRATNTETAVTYPAATNTEDPVRANAAIETEKSIFFALQQLMNTGTNTNIQEFWNVGLNTDLSGDVQELVIKPEQRDNSVNTVTSSVKVWDKMTSTVPSQRVEKAVNTTGVPHFERGINTEKQRVSVAAVNTDRAATMSRGVDCNIVQPENKSFLEEGMQSSRSSDISRSFRTTVEAAEPLEQSGIRTTITQRREIPSNSGFRRDFETTDSRTGDNQEFKEVTVSGGSGGRTTTTRVVKSFTRGGRSDFSDDLPTSDVGFRNIADVDSGFLGSGGSSSSTRTVTRVTGGGRSEIAEDFPETSVKEQVGGTESRSSHQTTTTSFERPEFEEEFGFGSSGSGGKVTRTVTAIHGGRSGLMEDFPAHEIGFQRSEREIDSSGMEGPDFGNSFGTGRSGGRAFTTRTVRTITRGGDGGRSEIVQEFPTGEVSFRDDGQEHFGSGAADGSTSDRTVTSRTVRRTYHGGNQLGNSDGYGMGSRASTIMARSGGTEGGSRLLGRMDEDFSRLRGQYEDIAGGSAGGIGGYGGSSRTVIKRTSGDPDDPESWTEETWVTEGPGDDSASRQMISSSQSAAAEIPEQSSAMSEMKVELQRSGQLLSSGMTMSGEPLRSIMKTGRQIDHSSDRNAFGHKGISFSDSSTSKYEASQELQSAFNLYDDWLEDSTRVTAQQLNSSLGIIQNSWFKVSSHKTSSSSQVEGFLNMIHSLSPDLMRQVINMADANGNTVLHYAASNCNTDVVRLLLNTNICDINHLNKTGCTAVMMAALTEVKSEQQREVVRQLFEMGDVNIQAPADGNELAGQTALMLAVSHGRLDMVKMLLEVGADINLQDDDGSTALMVAAEHGHVDIARLLLAHPECDAFLKDKDGSSAASIAREAGRQSIVSLLNAHINSRSSKPESRMASLHKARKVVTRITLSSPTEMN